MNGNQPVPRGLFALFFFFSLIALILLPAVDNAASNSGPGIVLYSYGPAMIQMVSPEGLRVGQDMLTGNPLTEIPGAKIVKEQVKGRPTGWTISFPVPVTGLYRLELIGTGRGGVVLDLDARDRTGKVINSHIFKRVLEGDTLHFFLSYSPDPGSENSLKEQRN
ncbi:MAG: hypothetical protein RRA32_09305 [bacterium]|nr:hypothetical protein [bacterium]